MRSIKKVLMIIKKVFLCILLIIPLIFCIGLYVKKYNNTIENIFIQCEDNHPDYIRVYYDNGVGFNELQSRYYFFSYTGKTVVTARHITNSKIVRIELHSKSKKDVLEYRMKIYYKGRQCNPHFLENAVFYNAEKTFIEDNTIVLKYEPQEEQNNFKNIVIDYKIDSSLINNHILPNKISWYQYNYIIANYEEYFLLLSISFILFLMCLYKIKLEKIRIFLMTWFTMIVISLVIFFIPEVRKLVSGIDKTYVAISFFLSFFLSFSLSNLSSTIKLKLHSILKSNLFFYISITLISSACFCSIYGVHVLNPQYVDWLKSNGGDLTQHYLGWMSFRNSPWTFPLCMITDLTYPFETSIIFTDSIPLFAVFFKLFRFFLPANFQYFGFYGIICFILQGILATKISKKFLKSKIQIFFATLLFIISPIMIYRMLGHTSLAGHWIILLALYAFIDENMTFKKECILWGIIGFLSSSIHMYFVAMNCFILMGICIRKFLNKEKIKQILLPVFCYLVMVNLTVFLLGGFSTKTSSPQGWGFSLYSMNLNAFFNPRGWSYFFKDFSYRTGQGEGFAYSGAGVFFLVLFAIFQIGSCKDFKSVKTEWKKWIPFIFVFIASFVFALSNVITFGEKTLFVIPLPKIVREFWSIFRATGRFSWICVYIIMIFSIKCISSIKRKQFLTVIIVFSFLLQLTDLHVILKNKRNYFNQIKEYSSEFFESSEWKYIANNDSIKHFYLAKNIEPRNEFLAFSYFVLANRKTVNRCYIAHGRYKVFDEYFQHAIENLQEDSIYIFPVENRFNLSCYKLHYYLIGKYIIGATKPLALLKEYIPNGNKEQ